MFLTPTVCILSFTFGSSLTWTSPVLPRLMNHTDGFFEEMITSDQATWIASSITLGMAFGNILYGYSTSVIGRKTSLLSVATFLIVPYMLMSIINVLEWYYLARFLIGVAVSGAYTSFNMYIPEVMGKSDRGRVAGYLISFTILGSLYSYIIGPYISIRIFNITLFIFPSLFFGLFLILGVETPHYYIMKGHKDKARRVLLKFRDENDNVEEEICDIENKVGQVHNRDLLTSLRLRATKIGFVNFLGLYWFQQLSGIFCIMFYNQQLFDLIGASLSPAICAIITGIIQFLSTLFTSTIIERFARKTLLYFSAVGMFLSNLLLGVYCCLQSSGINMKSVDFLPIVLISAYIWFHNSGFGMLPGIIPGEIFPTRCKGIAISATGLLNCTLLFVLTKNFQNLVDILGIGMLFLSFAAFCLLSIPFVKYFVVETRGKSLEAIQNELMDKNS